MIKFISNIIHSIYQKPSEIDLVYRAMERTRNKMKQLEAPFRFPESCCPSCACGYEWEVLNKKLHRQAVWLRVLLKRKNMLKEISDLEFEFGKQNLDYVQFRKNKHG
jgi:hypothetical protein